MIIEAASYSHELWGAKGRSNNLAELSRKTVLGSSRQPLRSRASLNYPPSVVEYRAIRWAAEPSRQGGSGDQRGATKTPDRDTEENQSRRPLSRISSGIAGLLLLVGGAPNRQRQAKALVGRQCESVGQHCDHDLMTMPPGHVRVATSADGPALVSLWARLFDDGELATGSEWREHAHKWLDRLVGETSNARFPLVAVESEVVATALGTLEVGVPSPYCPHGRVVRLANLVTLPDYRGLGYGTALVHDVVAWARLIEADRVDLSATAAGQRIYERAGFAMTSAPRMKLVL
jgi:GNAT superfamily N-acetyltransferase